MMALLMAWRRAAGRKNKMEQLGQGQGRYGRKSKADARQQRQLCNTDDTPGAHKTHHAAHTLLLLLLIS
jgi:hypothetical protein